MKTNKEIIMRPELSIFGKALQNYEIEEFFRLSNVSKTAFKGVIKAVEIMPGGLTNKNFRIFLEDGRVIAIRVAGKGTANYINRPAEKHNATQMASIGVAPEIYYYDPETGSQIVEYLNMDTMHSVDFQTRKEIVVKAAEVIRKYHDSGLEFKSVFDPIAKIYNYCEIMAEHKYEKRYNGWDRMIATLKRLKIAYAKNPPRTVPCHNDTLAENFMYDGTTMRVIDWEYSGMNDAHYDISCIVVEIPLDKEYEEILLKAYCGGEPSEIERARHTINKFLVTAHWSTWSLVQICYGKDADFYWEYGRQRAEQACGFLDEPEFEHYLEIIGG